MALKLGKNILKVKEEKKKKPTGEQYITIRLADDNIGAKERLQKVAQRNGITMNELLNKIIMAALEANEG